MASHHAKAQTNASRDKTEQNTSLAQKHQQQNQYFHQQTPTFPSQLSSDEPSWSGSFGSNHCSGSQNMIGHAPNHQADSLGYSPFDEIHCQKPVADAAASFFAK